MYAHKRHAQYDNGVVSELTWLFLCSGVTHACVNGGKCYDV